jgi:hypothetical protein
VSDSPYVRFLFVLETSALTFSWVFDKDSDGTIPTSSTTITKTSVIAIDEKGEHLAVFLDCLELDKSDSIPMMKQAGCDVTAAILSISTVFAFESLRVEAEESLAQLLDTDPMEGLRVEAIENFATRSYFGKPELFWRHIEDMAPEWKLKLAIQIVPVLINGLPACGRSYSRTVRPPTSEELKQAAARFNPKYASRAVILSSADLLGSPTNPSSYRRPITIEVIHRVCLR